MLLAIFVSAAIWLGIVIFAPLWLFQALVIISCCTVFAVGALFIIVRAFFSEEPWNRTRNRRPKDIDALTCSDCNRYVDMRCELFDAKDRAPIGRGCFAACKSHFAPKDF